MKKKINCWVCMDTGMITYYTQKNGIMYECAAHCNCKKGNEYRYDGRESSHKSNYYVASDQVIDESKKEEIAKENFKNYMSKEENVCMK